MKIPALENHKLLYVTPTAPDGKVSGKSVIAVDTVQAGVGDLVFIIDEGGSANLALNSSGLPIRTIIAGIIDEISIAERKDV
ncbi:MAG: EutN/CcmL family microcompartment protein [Spirochaetales bacterium]|nr:EutN/CcmL family microcompartment protein [Spirochaetales bacterium]